MEGNPPNLYTLTVGAIYDDLFSYDFVDVLWQAFDKDNLESLTLEFSKQKERIKMVVIDLRQKAKPP